MQPGPNPEDINVILSRFQAWAEKHPADGNGHRNGTTSEEIREIPYEEAMRQHRSRHQAPTRQSAVPSIAKKSVASPQKPRPAPNPSAEQALPEWITELPIVPEAESAIKVNDAAPAPPLEASTDPAGAAVQPVAPSKRATKSAAARRSATTKATQPEGPKSAPMAAKPEFVAQTSVDPLPIPAQQNKPARRTPTRPQRTKTAAAASTPPVKAAAIDAMPSIQPGQANATSSLIGPAINTAVASPGRNTTARRAGSGPAGKPRKLKRPPFCQVLTSTVQQSKPATATKKRAEPDRTRRITTRFSPAEERRIEKYAAERGVTVSALLRECALSAIATPRAAPGPAATAGKRKTTSAPARALANKTYTAPASFALGGWLALLRNRFLGPPVRFSGDA